MATDKDPYDRKLTQILEKYYHQRKEVLSAECPAAEELLDYMEGQLSPEKVASVHEHLPFCLECQDVVLSFKQPLDAAAFEDRPEESMEHAQTWPVAGSAER